MILSGPASGPLADSIMMTTVGLDRSSGRRQFRRVLDFAETPEAALWLSGSRADSLQSGPVYLQGLRQTLVRPLPAVDPDQKNNDDATQT